MKNKWLHFDIDKENIFGLICGLFMVLLSIAMTLFNNEISNIILRDILMILFLGFFTPIYYLLIIKKKNLSVLGIHKNKLTASLAINVITGISLLAMFISKNTEDIVFNINSFYAITYILVAGIFEMVFIYGFLRYEFERAFGILPAILITAIFSSIKAWNFVNHALQKMRSSFPLRTSSYIYQIFQHNLPSHTPNIIPFHHSNSSVDSLN